MGSLLIHIGYNKTGSTWLQEALFPRKDLGFLSFLELEDRERIYRSLVRQHPLTFDGVDILGYYNEKISLAENSGLLPVFSNERFSGDPHSAGYDTKEIADKLYQLFPDSRVVIVVREQQSMLLSTYRQYVRAGGPRSLRGYFHPPERGSRRVPMFDPEYFEYDHLVAYYQALFGKENVLVLPYEWLRIKPLDYVQKLLQFCDIKIDSQVLQALPFQQKVNRGYGRLTLSWKRQYNRFFLDNGLNPGAIWDLPYSFERKLVRIWSRLDDLLPKSWQQSAARKMKRYIAQQTKGKYAESNRRLEVLTGLSLRELDYELPHID
ncbi:MAG: sulfotransferase [Saprospiraceae bacterium]|nr:sulfotransferase [Saprospiraceae bacterium]